MQTMMQRSLGKDDGVKESSVSGGFVKMCEGWHKPRQYLSLLGHQIA